MLLLLSFNYTAPPAHVIARGENLTYVLFLLLLLVPNVKLGALIGGLGAAGITYWVTGHADGDLGSLSQVIEPPIWAVIGAVVGAFMSFLSKSIFQIGVDKSESK